MEKNSNLLLLPYILLIPTGIAALLIDIIPISYNGRLSGGGVLVVLIIIFICSLLKRGRWYFTNLDVLFLMLIGVKIIFFVISTMKFTSMETDFFLRQRNVAVSTAITYLSYYVLTHFLKLTKKSIHMLMSIYSIGAITTIIGAFALVYYMGLNLGLANIYEMRRSIKHIGDEIVKEDLITVNLYEFDTKYKLLNNWKSGVESTLTIGPFVAFLGSFFLGFALFKKGLQKHYWVSLSMMCYFAAFLMASRSAILIIIFGIFTVAIGFQFITNARFQSFAVRNLLIFFLSLLVLVAIVISTDYKDTINLAMIKQQARWSLWYNAIKLIIANPFGYGQAYIFIENNYGTRDFPLDAYFNHNHAHNAFFQIGVETGLLGILLVSSILFSALYYSYRNLLILRKLYFNENYVFPNTIAALNLGTLGALVCSVVGMIFESKFFVSASIFTPNIILMIVFSIKINVYLKSSNSLQRYSANALK